MRKLGDKYRTHNATYDNQLSQYMPLTLNEGLIHTYPTTIRYLRDYFEADEDTIYKGHRANGENSIFVEFVYRPKLNVNKMGEYGLEIAESEKEN